MTGRLGVLLLLLVGTMSAQINSGPAFTMGRVRVRVSFANNADCALGMRAELIQNAGATIAESPVDSECVADFFDVPPGNYSVQVVGGEIAETGSSEFTLSSGMMQDVEVRARRMGETDLAQRFAGSSFVSVKELNVPSNAQKEFDKASRLIARKEWAKASERLHKAIEIYPQYAAAYNNLGAVYFHMGDGAQARSALQSAIALNDHLPSAYVNMARLSFSTKEFPEVETYVQKALSLAAPDTDELTLLAVAQLADRHFDQAIETSRQAHRSQLSHHAFLHLVAARAEDVQGKADASISDELQQYLKEEPHGPRAEEVKKSLALIGSQAQSR